MSEGRAEWILREARKRPPAERSAFLRGACAGDSGLRQRLEVRLAAHDLADTPTSQETEVAQPTLKTDWADTPNESAGQTIGRYKVLQKIGEGGCGAVFMAEQEQPAL